MRTALQGNDGQRNVCVCLSRSETKGASKAVVARQSNRLHACKITAQEC